MTNQAQQGQMTVGLVGDSFFGAMRVCFALAID
jgi:hypothetical protein